MTATPIPRRRYLPAGFVRVTLGRRGSLLLHRRTLLVSAMLLVLTIGVGLATVATGAYDIAPLEALRVLLRGEGTDLDRFIVTQQRLPRALAAALVGVALGTSGAIFQSVARNPLGSPDIIGFTTGAASGGLLVILLTGGATAAGVAMGTLLGGAATAAVVVAISLRRGLRGDRLVLTGIAIAAMLAALNDYLLSRAPIEQAEAAKAWQHGSLNAISWGPLPVLGIALAIALPYALIHGRLLRVLELGDDAATGVGLRLTRTRIVAVGIGVALAALAVATAGPIGFLALAAPQLAARLSRSPGVSILASATMGSLILVVADLGAQRLLSPFQIPVGLVTAAVGGAYLVWMLVFGQRRIPH